MTDRLAAIVAFVGRQVLSGTVPRTREELIAMLRDGGFDEADIAEAMDRVDGPAAVLEAGSGERAARPIEVLQLSEDATRFLNTLRDLGYLDDLMEDEVLDLLMDDFADARARGIPLRNVELDDLRRHVAVVLFDRQNELDDETVRFLHDEWQVAFH